jgi:hypothetical protein
LALRERYAAIAGQIAHDSAAVRQAGVYALTALADDWHEFGEDEERQVCINLLQWYLRVPFPQGEGSAGPDLAEREIRQTIVALIAERRSRPADNLTSWADAQTSLAGSLLSNCTIKGDLTGMDISGADLSGADLTGARLVCANLDHANLYNANISDSDLRCVSLQGADMRKADLTRSILIRANLSGKSLSGIKLAGADLFCADIDYCDADKANFNFANMSGVSLDHAELSGSTFRGANLIGACFVNCGLEGSDFYWSADDWRRASRHRTPQCDYEGS